MSTSAQTLVVPELKDILFATDFSPCSEAAIPVLRSMALCCGSTVHVVHVVSPQPETLLPFGMEQDETGDWDVDKVKQWLTANGEFREIPCTSVVTSGDVSEVVNNLAKEQRIGLIVLGTHGRRGIKKLVLGSTAEEIIRTAPCPVLTIGPQACREAKTKAAGPIIVAADLEAWPHPALSFAASLARANHVPLVFVHAIPLNLDGPETNVNSIPFTPYFAAKLTERSLAASRRCMEETAALLFGDLKPQIVVGIAPPADLIVSTANELQAGMIVMGARQTGAPSMATHFPGAVATAVLCEAPCPVMTIRD